MRDERWASGTLLVIDDDYAQIETYCQWFQEFGFRTYSCLGLTELQACVEKGANDYWGNKFKLDDIDVAVIDYTLANGKSGLEVARWIAIESNYSVRRFLFSGEAEAPQFRNAWLDESMIDDFGTKREEKNTIALRVGKLANLRQRERRTHAGVLLADERLRKITDHVGSHIGTSLMPVLILGPSGSGKESIALRIHEASGLPDHFVAVNCGAFDDNLMRSEFFGYTDGAFTDAKGHKLGLILKAAGFQGVGRSRGGDFLAWLEGLKPKEVNMVNERGVVSIVHKAPETRGFCGTIFLDEFADLSNFAQGLLLRFLDGHGFSPVGYHGPPLAPRVRLIAATNKVRYILDSTEGIRHDLVWRLAGWVLDVPGLAERGAEVVLGTAEQYVEELNRSNRSILLGKRLRLSDDAFKALEKLTNEDNFFKKTGEEFLGSGNFRSLRWLISRAFWITFGEQRSSSVIDREAINEAAQRIRLSFDNRGTPESGEAQTTLTYDEANLLQTLINSEIGSPWELQQQQDFDREMELDYSVLRILAKRDRIFLKAHDHRLFESPSYLNIDTIGASHGLHRWSYLAVLALLWQCSQRKEFLWKVTDELLDHERSQEYLKPTLKNLFRLYEVEIEWTGGTSARGLRDLMLWARGREAQTGTTIKAASEGSQAFRRWLASLSEKVWGGGD